MEEDIIALLFILKRVRKDLEKLFKSKIDAPLSTSLRDFEQILELLTEIRELYISEFSEYNELFTEEERLISGLKFHYFSANKPEWGYKEDSLSAIHQITEHYVSHFS